MTTRYDTSHKKILEGIKYQLAQLAYDIIMIRLHGSSKDETVETPFDSLPNDYKNAFIEGVWIAMETSKNKNYTNSQRETVTKKQEDNGYLLYSGVKLLIKNNPGLFTYAKFPDSLKEEYRALADKLYYKMDNDEGDD